MSKKSNYNINRRERLKAESAKTYRTLKEKDVLFGRGTTINMRPGNLWFRETVLSRRKEYLNSERQERKIIAEKIVKAVHERGGRFMKHKGGDTNANLYVIVCDERAVEKCQQALRENKWVNKPITVGLTKGPGGSASKAKSGEAKGSGTSKPKNGEGKSAGTSKPKIGEGKNGNAKSQAPVGGVRAGEGKMTVRTARKTLTKPKPKPAAKPAEALKESAAPRNDEPVTKPRDGKPTPGARKDEPIAMPKPLGENPGPNKACQGSKPVGQRRPSIPVGKPVGTVGVLQNEATSGEKRKSPQQELKSNTSQQANKKTKPNEQDGSLRIPSGSKRATLSNLGFVLGRSSISSTAREGFANMPIKRRASGIAGTIHESTSINGRRHSFETDVHGSDLVEGLPSMDESTQSDSESHEDDDDTAMEIEEEEQDDDDDDGDDDSLPAAVSLVEKHRESLRMNRRTSNSTSRFALAPPNATKTEQTLRSPMHRLMQQSPVPTNISPATSSAWLVDFLNGGSCDSSSHSYQACWEEHFVALVRFKEVHGHCVPAPTAGSPHAGSSKEEREHARLADWASAQRQIFREIQNGRRPATDEDKLRFRRLQALGFPLDYEEWHWNRRYDELVRHREAARDDQEVDLSKQLTIALWIKEQRRLYLDGRLGKIQPMRADRVQKLKKLNFEWAVDSNTADRNTSAPMQMGIETSGTTEASFLPKTKFSEASNMETQKDSSSPGMAAEVILRKSEPQGLPKSEAAQPPSSTPKSLGRNGSTAVTPLLPFMVAPTPQNTNGPFPKGFGSVAASQKTTTKFNDAKTIPVVATATVTPSVSSEGRVGKKAARTTEASPPLPSANKGPSPSGSKQEAGPELGDGTPTRTGTTGAKSISTQSPAAKVASESGKATPCGEGVAKDNNGTTDIATQAASPFSLTEVKKVSEACGDASNLTTNNGLHVTPEPATTMVEEQKQKDIRDGSPLAVSLRVKENIKPVQVDIAA